jgi:hypothetical protein
VDYGALIIGGSLIVIAVGLVILLHKTAHEASLQEQLNEVRRNEEARITSLHDYQKKLDQLDKDSDLSMDRDSVVRVFSGTGIGADQNKSPGPGKDGAS